MNPELNDYINEMQFSKICKYWRIIDNHKLMLNSFDWTKSISFDEFSDEDEELLKIYANHNKQIELCYQMLERKIKYYEEEYANYLLKQGLALNDQNQNEHLFNLLNNGIIL